MEPDDATKLAAALDAARRNPSPVLVIPSELLPIPGARAAFAALAKETGKLFGVPPSDPVLENAQAAAAAKTFEKTIPLGDGKAFLENLSGIAAGKVNFE